MNQNANEKETLTMRILKLRRESKIPMKHYNNLAKQERQGLLELKNNNHIVIKKADKGSAVVVMNTSDYLREGYRQLSDHKFYQLKPTDETEKYSKSI